MIDKLTSLPQRLALPTVVALMMTTVLGIAEMNFVSSLGTAAIAGTSLVISVLMHMTMVPSGAVGGGVASTIAPSNGANRLMKRNVSRSTQSLSGLESGSCSPVFVVAFVPALYAVPGGWREALHQALCYSNVHFGASVLFWVLRLLQAALRGSGNARFPAAIALVVLVLYIRSARENLRLHRHPLRLQHLRTILMIPMFFGFGTAALNIIGANAGAVQIARARPVALINALIVGARAEAVGILVAFFSRAWLELFTSDPAVLAIGTRYLLRVGLLYGVMAIGMELYFPNQGAGHVTGPVLAGVARFSIAAAGQSQHSHLQSFPLKAFESRAGGARALVRSRASVPRGAEYLPHSEQLHNRASWAQGGLNENGDPVGTVVGAVG